MVKNKKKPFPKKEDILQFILDSDKPVGKRDIARAFNIKGQDKIELKKILKSLKEDGHLKKQNKKLEHSDNALPDICPVEVIDLNNQNAIAEPIVKGEKEYISKIYLSGEGRERKFQIGNRYLVRLKKRKDKTLSGHIIRFIGQSIKTLIAYCYLNEDQQIQLIPVSRKTQKDLFVPKALLKKRHPGELVTLDIKYDSKKSQDVVEKITPLASSDLTNKLSYFAIFQHKLSHEFPKEAVKQAKAFKELSPKDCGNKRKDLTHIPFVTIDGEDARDFDDAVWTEKSEKYQSGWHILVAIADVSFYVGPETALDQEAYTRANSTYFPDQVVPMLPEELSNELCSLKPDVYRAAIIADIHINNRGEIEEYTFYRALIKSAARLTYTQVESALNNEFDTVTKTLYQPVIKPLFQAYEVLHKARKEREALEIDSEESKIILDEEGNIKEITYRERLSSHQLIEELMILANQAAALSIEKSEINSLFRVHEKPSSEKIEDLKKVLEKIGFAQKNTSQFTPGQFNKILKKSQNTPFQAMVNQQVLRSQSQANYRAHNFGHFGLALEHYTHFTSPIRRYADLIVHRSIVRIFKLGEGGLTDEEIKNIDQIGEHISSQERKCDEAERDTNDRYVALFLQKHIGNKFKGIIRGITSFGLFINISSYPAEGFLPIRHMSDDYYIYDDKHLCLIGERTRKIFRLGDEIPVTLLEANPITGSILFDIEKKTRKPSRPHRKARSKPSRKKDIQSKSKVKRKRSKKNKK